MEQVQTASAGLHYPYCVDGAGTCPPEDCGGTPGYSHLKVILADPAHEEHHAVAHRPCYATPRQDVRADLAS